MSAEGRSLKHSKGVVGCVSPVGGVVSSMKNCCLRIVLFPAQSSNLYLLVTTVGSASPPSQFTEVISSSRNTTDTSLTLPQLSVIPVTKPVSGLGISPKH